MKRLRWCCLGLWFLVLVQGCATVGGYRLLVGTWVGHPLDDLIVNWGPPTTSTVLSDGGVVVQYVRVRTVSSGGYSYSAPRQVTTNANVYGSGGWAAGSATTTVYDRVDVPVSYEQKSCTTNFRANASRIITIVTFNGNDCLAVAPSAASNSSSAEDGTDSHSENVGLGVLWN